MLKISLLGCIIFQLTVIILLLSSIDSADAAHHFNSPIPAEPVVKQRDATGLVIPVKVVIYQSFEELNIAFVAHYGGVNMNNTLGWYRIKDGVCELHLTDLKQVRGDPNMDTWGHELAHCMYGLYHK